MAGRFAVEARVARTHLAITVELVHGVRTGDFRPRPGRVLIAARTATFEQIGKAIDDAFARWDHGLADLPPILLGWERAHCVPARCVKRPSNQPVTCASLASWTLQVEPD